MIEYAMAAYTQTDHHGSFPPKSINQRASDEAGDQSNGRICRQQYCDSGEWDIQLLAHGNR
ncbi:MAG: hypothetical protein A2Z14_06915 [Chloroflexi bacterium RBG_16_48_8]|nr:MAG: hypothetical protein A2Z14_06915 [Chloroflexi bacterium RBG_16_48_8]